MEHFCSHCSSRHYYDEMVVLSTEIRFYECYNSGKVIFAPLRNPLLLVKELLTGQSAIQRQFRQNIRKYNNILSMTSFKENWDDNTSVISTFHVTVTVHGQLFHLIGPEQLLPELPLSFMSINFHDPDYPEQAKMWLRHDTTLDNSLLQDISKLVYDLNPYVHTFNTLHEWVFNDSYPVPYQIVIHADKPTPREHQPRCNASEASEVSAIIPGVEDNLISYQRYIILQRLGIIIQRETCLQRDQCCPQII